MCNLNLPSNCFHHNHSLASQLNSKNFQFNRRPSLLRIPATNVHLSRGIRGSGRGKARAALRFFPRDELIDWTRFTMNKTRTSSFSSRMPFVDGEKRREVEARASLQRDSESIGGQPKREKSGENKEREKKPRRKRNIVEEIPSYALKYRLYAGHAILSSRTVDGIIALSRND